MVDPEGNGAAVHVEQAGDIRGAMSFEAESDSVKPLGKARSFFAHCLPTQSQQSLDRPLVSSGKHAVHVAREK